MEHLNQHLNVFNFYESFTTFERVLNKFPDIELIFNDKYDEFNFRDSIQIFKVCNQDFLLSTFIEKIGKWVNENESSIHEALNEEICVEFLNLFPNPSIFPVVNLMKQICKDFIKQCKKIQQNVISQFFSCPNSSQVFDFTLMLCVD
jgi:hypothetical protein